MAQLYLYHDIPIKAARVLQTGLDDGSIEKTEKNYELLAQAYMHAREWDKAIKPLTVAAEKSDKGRFYEQLGQSYLQDEKWRDAEQAFVMRWKKAGCATPPIHGFCWVLRARVSKSGMPQLPPSAKLVKTMRPQRTRFAGYAQSNASFRRKKEARRVKIRLIRVCKTIAIMKPYHQL